MDELELAEYARYCYAIAAKKELGGEPVTAILWSNEGFRAESGAATPRRATAPENQHTPALTEPNIPQGGVNEKAQ